MPLPDLVVRMSYLCSSVVVPMFLSIRLNNMGILLEEASSHIPTVLTDEALEQTDDWTAAAALFSRLFRSGQPAEKPIAVLLIAALALPAAGITTNNSKKAPCPTALPIPTDA